MKYLPGNYKMRPGLGGPTPMLKWLRCNENVYESTVASQTTLQIAIFPTDSQERVLSVKNYSNTDFVHIIIENRHYAKIEKIAESLNTSPENLINSVFLSVLKTYGTRSLVQRFAETKT
jgi:hypothetical protein